MNLSPDLKRAKQLRDLYARFHDIPGSDVLFAMAARKRELASLPLFGDNESDDGQVMVKKLKMFDEHLCKGFGNNVIWRLKKDEDLACDENQANPLRCDSSLVEINSSNKKIEVRLGNNDVPDDDLFDDESMDGSQNLEESATYRLTIVDKENDLSGIPSQNMEGKPLTQLTPKKAPPIEIDFVPETPPNIRSTSSTPHSIKPAERLLNDLSPVRRPDITVSFDDDDSDEDPRPFLTPVKEGPFVPEKSKMTLDQLKDAYLTMLKKAGAPPNGGKSKRPLKLMRRK